MNTKIYKADIGSIEKIQDSKSKNNNKLVYIPDKTINGFCYKDYNNFKNNPDEICYISEGAFENDLFFDYVKENKDKLIEAGGLSTTNSIKEEIRNCLEYEEYYYEYEQNGIVTTIEAHKFDDKLISYMANEVFDAVDWETTQSYIYETDWTLLIENYYSKKIKGDDLEL